MPTWTLYPHFFTPHSWYLVPNSLPNQIRTHPQGPRKSLSQFSLPRVDHNEDVSIPGRKLRELLVGGVNGFWTCRLGSTCMLGPLGCRSEPGWEGGQAGTGAGSHPCCHVPIQNSKEPENSRFKPGQKLGQQRQQAHLGINTPPSLILRRAHTLALSPKM